MEIEITKVTSRGQVVIPHDIREQNNIREGERFLVYGTGDSIKNLEEAKDLKGFEEAFASMWKTAKSRGITKKDVEKEISLYRKENA